MAQWRFKIFDVLDSTSSYCLRQLEVGEQPGFVVVALEQQSGRGTKGRSWESSAGNLAFSFALSQHSTITSQNFFSVLPYLTALAVRHGLARCISSKEELEIFNNSITLKWPNDLLLNGKKLAGILIESTLGSVCPAIVVGIGVNLAKAPKVSGREAAALVDMISSPVSPEAAARSIMAAWDKLIVLLEENGVSAIFKEWEKYSFPLGTILEVTNTQGCFTGAYKGLSPLGALQLQDENGIVHEVLAGEIG